MLKLFNYYLPKNTLFKRFCGILILYFSLSVSASATEFRDAMLDQLTTEGFKIKAVQNTFLGRLKIYAIREDIGRELVINPYTGEVFRDFSKSILERKRPLLITLDDDKDTQNIDNPSIEEFTENEPNLKLTGNKKSKAENEFEPVKALNGNSSPERINASVKANNVDKKEEKPKKGISKSRSTRAKKAKSL
jgi:hypothetical protein